MKTKCFYFLFCQSLPPEQCTIEVQTELNDILFLTQDYVEDREDLITLAYLIYDGDTYVGFGVLEFYVSTTNPYVEAHFTEGTKQQYALVISQPHVFSNIVIAVHPAYRRRGLSERIEKGLLMILQNQTNVPLVYHVASRANLASIALAQRVGFTEVQTTDPHERVFIYLFHRKPDLSHRSPFQYYV